MINQPMHVFGNSSYKDIDGSRKQFHKNMQRDWLYEIGEEFSIDESHMLECNILIFKKKKSANQRKAALVLFMKEGVLYYVYVPPCFTFKGEWNPIRCSFKDVRNQDFNHIFVNEESKGYFWKSLDFWEGECKK